MLQVAFYFSSDNLQKDGYLRRQMDVDGLDRAPRPATDDSVFVCHQLGSSRHHRTVRPRQEVNHRPSAHHIRTRGAAQ